MIIVRQRLKLANVQYIGYGAMTGPGCSGAALGLTGLERLCETHGYGIQRTGGVCPGKEDAGAEYASLPGGALAYMDMGVFSGAGAADVYAVCAWVWPGQSGVAGGGAGGGGCGGGSGGGGGRGGWARLFVARLRPKQSRRPHGVVCFWPGVRALC